MAAERVDPGYLPVADVEIDVVRPATKGFVLEGEAADGARYRLELDLDMPVDQRTRTVLAELFSQSEWRILRRAGANPMAALKRARQRVRPSGRQSDRR